MARLFTPEDRAVVTPNGPNGYNIKNVIGKRYEGGSWVFPSHEPVLSRATQRS